MIPPSHIRALQAVNYAQSKGMQAAWIGYGSVTILCSISHRNKEIERHQDKTDWPAELKRQLALINKP